MFGKILNFDVVEVILLFTLFNKEVSLNYFSRSKWRPQKLTLFLHAHCIQMYICVHTLYPNEYFTAYKEGGLCGGAFARRFSGSFGATGAVTGGGPLGVASRLLRCHVLS